MDGDSGYRDESMSMDESRQVSAEEIAAMRHSLVVIKQAATKRMAEKDAQIEALESENAQLRDAQDRGSAEAELEGERRKLAEVKADLDSALEREGQLLSRVDSLEMSGRGDSGLSADLRDARRDVNRLEDEKRELEKRMQAFNQVLQSTRRTFNRKNEALRSAPEEDAIDILEAKSAAADRAIEEMCALANLAAPVEEELYASANAYNSGASRGEFASSNRDEQHKSWKSKAENLTTELQVLQKELRRHLNELRGELDTGDWGIEEKPRDDEDDGLVLVQKMRADRQVYASPPRSDGRMRIVGRAVQGEILEAQADVRMRSIVWCRKTPGDSSYEPIPFAKKDTYTLAREDVGCEIEVTAQSSEGELTATLGDIQPAYPDFLSARIDGAQYNASVLTVEGDYYGGREGKTKYRWSKSVNERDWSELPHADARSYQVTCDDVSSYLRCEITPVRADGVAGRRVIVSTNQIMLDPKVHAQVNSYWRNGQSSFPITLRRSLEKPPSPDQAVTLELRREFLILKSEGRTLREVPYSNDVKVLMHPRETRMFKLRVGYKSTLNAAGRPQPDDMIMSAPSARNRDVVSITLFGFRQLQDHKLKSKKSWGRASRDHGKSIPSTKETSVKSESIKERGSRKKDLTREEEEERARIHAKRKEEMSATEYVNWKLRRVSDIKKGMSMEEWESFRDESRSKKSIKSTGSSIKEDEEASKKKRKRRSQKAEETPEPESESKKKRRRRSSAKEEAPEEEEEDEDPKQSSKERAKARQDAMKEKLEPRDYLRWKEEQRLRRTKRDELSSERYTTWRASRPRDDLMPEDEFKLTASADAGEDSKKRRRRSQKPIDDEDGERLRRHQERKESMTPEEYDMYVDAKMKKKKDTMTEAEFEEWQLASADRKRQRSEGGEKKRRRRASKAAEEPEVVEEPEPSSGRRRRSKKPSGAEEAADAAEAEGRKKRRRSSKKETEAEVAPPPAQETKEEKKARKKAEYEELKLRDPEEYKRVKAAHKQKKQDKEVDEDGSSKKRRRRSQKP